MHQEFVIADPTHEALWRGKQLTNKHPFIFQISYFLQKISFKWALMSIAAINVNSNTENSWLGSLHGKGNTKLASLVFVPQSYRNFSDFFLFFFICFTGMIDRMVEKTSSTIVWNPVGHPKSLAKLDVGGWVRAGGW